jgi:hypothetical protein
MLRYYMTPETQQSLIAESNRLIARRSMTRHSGQESGAFDTGMDAPGSLGEDSAFARLVADLQTVSAGSRNQ